MISLGGVRFVDAYLVDPEVPSQVVAEAQQALVQIGSYV